ncbi:MAG: porin [Planctomycetota bacterium]
MNFKSVLHWILLVLLSTGSVACGQQYSRTSYQDNGSQNNGQVWSLSDGQHYFDPAQPTPVQSAPQGAPWSTPVVQSGEDEQTSPRSSLLDNRETVTWESLGDKETEEKVDYPTSSITGFFHLDSAWYSQDDLNKQTLGDINDGLGFRRARLAAKGEVAEDISYIVEFDIAQSQARFVDVWMQASGTRLGNIRIGRYRQPFGMSELTSVRELPFLERPVTFTQGPFRQTGVMIFDTLPGETGTYWLSGYRVLSDNFGNVFSDSGGYGLATRLTRIVAEWGRNQLIHFGVDYSYNDPGRGVVQLVSTNEVFVAQNPNLGPAGLSVLPIEGVTPFVNTGVIPADSAEFFNIESAIAMGRMAIQSEARWARVEQPGGNTAVFPGGYVQFRYMLTGETIPYSRTNGVFGRVVPCCPWTPSGGIGAWEFTGRVSHIDLNDGGIDGRRLTDFTVGCNWYWNQYTKMQFNWIHSRLADPTLGDSLANAFAVRAQIDF